MGTHSRMSQWRDSDHADFLAKSLEVLKRGEDNSFTQLILELCRADGASIQQILFTADLLSLDEAARVVRLATKSDPGFQVYLVAAVKAEIEKAGSSVRSEDPARLMEMLVHTVDANRLIPFLTKLCEHGDEWIRSKAVLLTGRVARRLPKSMQLLRDPDPRVRANAVESLWGRKDEETIQSLKEASLDTHHRVAGNALLGLYQAGDLSSIHGIVKMAKDPEVGRQLAGIWLLGQTRDPRFVNFVQLALATSTGRQKFALLKAGRMIKTRRDELMAKPALRMEAVRTERNENGQVLATFLVFTDEGRICAPDEILATNAVVMDGEMRIDHLRWAAWGGAENVHAAFLVPMRKHVGESFATQLVSAMELGISGKRRGDRWAIQKYELVPGGDASQVAPVEFSDSADALRTEQLRAARGASPGLAEGIERLIPMFPARVGCKHLVVVLDPDLSPTFRVDAGWAERFKLHNVVPHVIACGDLCDEAFDGWRQLCAARQGVFLECNHAAELPLALRRVSLSLQSGFEISYKLGRMLPPADGAEPVTIEIFAAVGYGRLKLDGEGRVIANEPGASVSAAQAEETKTVAPEAVEAQVH